MNTITKDELKMALTPYYQDFQNNPESFDEYSTSEDDAEAVTNIIFEIVKSNHE